MIIKNLYDSHVHLLMTGENLLQINLSQIENEDDLKKILGHSSLQRKDWVIGYGWDENKFQKGFQLNKQVLDRICENKYVFLVRTDGHSSCVNSKLLKMLEYDKNNPYQEFIETSATGEPTGILREAAHMKLYEHLPGYEKTEIKNIVKTSLQHFISQGFTYIRDMTTRTSQWESELDLYENNEIHCFIEHNFVCENHQDIERTLADLNRAKKQENDRMKIRGIKFFYDGSLGSRTAALSMPYADEKRNSGNVLWEKEHVKELISRAWNQSFDVSVHTIGDRAVDEIVNIAKQVAASGIVGRLNLEHVQVVKPETIRSMKPLHVVCHMQPCHWLSDKVWLKDRLGPLYNYTFPWESLSRAGIPLQFGSDSPIEKSSLVNNLEALKLSKSSGIKNLSVDPLSLHCYQSADQLSSESHFDSEYNVKKVIFNKKTIYES